MIVWHRVRVRRVDLSSRECVLAHDPCFVQTKCGARHLPQIPGLIALEGHAAAAGRGAVADMGVVRPDDHFGVVQMRLISPYTNAKPQSNSTHAMRAV